MNKFKDLVKDFLTGNNGNSATYFKNKENKTISDEDIDKVIENLWNYDEFYDSMIFAARCLGYEEVMSKEDEDQRLKGVEIDG